ncbi:MAG TPA: 1,4-dihydroxy-2-naphthoate polyprenyltransferase [Actinomycetota bacterium]|nr:1,4-dihydroxy-2-naphthoate polyprenyltransferase [Actinomycetota bacterium]
MNVWVEAARPKTLSAAVAPVVVGTAAADRFIAWRAAAALLVALALQVAVNYANDLFDAARGVDTEARVGPRRAVASGLIAPGEMKVGIGIALAVAAGAGTALAVAVDARLLLVGVVAIVALLGYSGGPKPYASAGLGEVFVFVFFGLVATVGSSYVHDERVVRASVIAAIPIGFLATAILVVNNLRDIESDAAAGKRTLAVRIGDARTRSLLRILVLGAFLFVPVIAGDVGSAWAMLPLAALPLALPLVTLSNARGTGLIPVLTSTARLQLVFALLLAAGLWRS